MFSSERGSILLVLSLGVLVMGGAALGGSCARVDLEGGGGPPLPRGARVDAGEVSSEAECDRLGLPWIINGAFAAGGYCQLREPLEPPPVMLHQLDAGAEVDR